MSQILYQLDHNHLAFPPIESALSDPNGLLAVGGDLSAQRLIKAYKQGIFPWFNENDPIMWWSPDPRCVVYNQNIRINRTLRKAINKAPYKITLNHCFTDVIKFCANAPFRNESTWIIPEMLQAYQSLHQLGYAHSIEVWQEQQLVGGLYGVAIGGYFSGESMFYKQANASKFALVALSQLLQSVDISFIDCQLLNPFLADMGATEISRDCFRNKQLNAITKDIPENFWKAKELFIAI